LLGKDGITVNPMFEHSNLTNESDRAGSMTIGVLEQFKVFKDGGKAGKT